MRSAVSLYRHVGKRVEEFRVKKKLTQARLAEIVSLSRTSITNIESGRQKLLVHTLWDIARVLGVRPADFFPSESEMKDAASVKPKGKLSPEEATWFQSIVSPGGKNAHPQTTNKTTS